MAKEDELRQKLDRLSTWADRFSAQWEKSMSRANSLFVEILHDLEAERLNKEEQSKTEIERLRGDMDSEGKNYTRNKYLLEKDVNKTKLDVEAFKQEHERQMMHFISELRRAEEERLASQLSFERQKTALKDLYEEKQRHLSVTRDKFVRDVAQAETRLRQERARFEKELSVIRGESEKKLADLTNTLEAKREGWEIALETLKKELSSLNAQRDDIEKKLSSIQSEKEKELEGLRKQILLSQEQLEIDKVTLVEKAEEDQRHTETEVTTLQEKMNTAQQELNELILKREAEKKNMEDAFLAEETSLKDTVRSEAEKRDYEQKLFKQEKSAKEKELQRLREDYERRKSHWDNQIKTLTMQKSVQDAEFGAEKMRTDREARLALRSLETKRDDLRRRLTEIKSRHAAFSANTEKELGLMNQRWRWRKDRLWVMWQTRLDTLKKERELLHEQLEGLESTFQIERAALLEDEQSQQKRTDDLRQVSFNLSEQMQGERKTREIQLELEKAKLITQIKECESLVSDWMDKQKLTQDDFSRRKVTLAEGLEFMDKWYQMERDQTEVFLHSLEKAMGVLGAQLDQLKADRRDAA